MMAFLFYGEIVIARRGTKKCKIGVGVLLAITWNGTAGKNSCTEIALISTQKASLPDGPMPKIMLSDERNLK
ncbi:hypothetical protein hrd7_22680 [Leptolinea sp. HRD-7]|jgi:hypothetical protein|nr:hypothetical protein hrd7_22680 [Leptolinea sp. HRD-7]